MDAIAFSPGFRLRSISAIRKESFGIRLISPKEIADGPSQYASQKKFSGLTVSSIQADGNRRRRPPHKDTSTGRERETYENKASQSSDVKPSNSDNQEEIISLFRRIQTSISESDSTSPKRRSSGSSQDSASAESVLEVLRKSRKQGKGEKSQESRIKAPSRRRKSPPQKEQEYASVPDFKLTRPPSNFVKRSPIPHPTIKKDDIVEKKIEDASVESLNLKDMKIVELKEIAKSRGLKGYSKLKKSELVELLSS